MSFLINPYRFAAAAVPWTPANITTALWIDAADATTVTESSGLISQVNDKSGNARNFTASSGAQPTYSANTLNGQAVLTFSGAQWLTSANTAATWNFLHNATGGSVFFVTKAGNTSDPNASLCILGNNAGSSDRIGLLLTADDRSSQARNNNFFSFVTRGVSGAPTSSNLIGNNNFPVNTACQSSVILDNANAVAASRSEVRVNGGTAYANNTSTLLAATANATFSLQIGAAGNNSVPLIGYIAEFVITTGQIATADRERIEGYLAHKWGLTGSLPAGHPYKTSAPTV